MSEEQYMLDNTGEPYIWAPRYISVLQKRQSTDPEEAAYWNQFGFDKLTLPESTHIPYIHNRWQVLVARFNERYYFRRIGNETMERWQIRLQNRFDEIIDEMERAYKLYATTTQIDEVIAGTKTTYAHGNSHSGTDSTTNTNVGRYVDTPDSATNEDDDYADRRQYNDGGNTVTYNSSNTLSGYDKTEALGPDVLAGVNRSIRAWTDIDTFFISMFENNFLNIFG